MTKIKYAYFEDFKIGQKFTSGPYKVTEKEVIEFAEKYDPQIMHTNPKRAADETIFGKLIASGWHTAAMSMNLFVKAYPDIKGGMIGRSIEKLEWPRPTYPGDELNLECIITKLQPSKSRPEIGIVSLQNTTLNQKGQTVQRAHVIMIIPTRKA